MAEKTTSLRGETERSNGLNDRLSIGEVRHSEGVSFTVSQIRSILRECCSSGVKKLSYNDLQVEFQDPKVLTRVSEDETVPTFSSTVSRRSETFETSSVDKANLQELSDLISEELEMLAVTDPLLFEQHALSGDQTSNGEDDRGPESALYESGDQSG